MTTIPQDLPLTPAISEEQEALEFWESMFGNSANISAPNGTYITYQDFIKRLTEYTSHKELEADKQGYLRGVYNFRNYFMDASIPAQRNPIGMGIAEELVKDYKYPYKLKGNFKY